MALRSVTLLLPLALVVGVVVACSHQETKLVDVPDDDDDTSQPPADSGLGVLSFKPPEMYSGFDGTHTFKAPFAVYDYGTDVQVTSSNPDAVQIQAVTLSNPVTDTGTDNGKYYFAITKAAGDITLTVKSNGKTASGILHITQYPAGQYDIGSARYQTAETVDGKTSPPCTDCHVNGAAVNHSPSALVSVKDDDVGRIISTGLNTGNFPIQLNNPTYPDGHKWSTTNPTTGQDEKPGLITFLRALEPKGFK